MRQFEFEPKGWAAERISADDYAMPFAPSLIQGDPYHGRGANNEWRETGRHATRVMRAEFLANPADRAGGSFRVWAPRAAP